MIRLLQIILIVCLFNSCDKIKPNITVTASGYVIDTVKNKNVSGVTIEVLACKAAIRFSAPHYDSITSVITNNKGQYSISFISNDKDNFYKIRIGGSNKENYTTAISQYEASLNIGENNGIRLQAREFTRLKAHIIIYNNKYDSLQLGGDNFYNNFYNSIDFFQKHSIDTIIIFKVLPMSKEKFTFSRPNNMLWSFMLDSINIRMDDTTYYSKTINILQ